jgi:hypothetical protein
MSHRLLSVLCFAAAVSLTPRLAADDSPLATEVLPLFKARCVKCHGPSKQEGKLNLGSAAHLARGGEQGPVIERGKPEASLLWQRVEADEMPPDEPLSADEKSTLLRWIAGGAAGLAEQAIAGPTEHWAFLPLAGALAPDVKSAAVARNGVDLHVLAALEAHGLGLGPEADRHSLIRRVCFDLTGLPPTPQETAQFVADRSPDAYERMVDGYLASPRYGQRWGKLWLDAAGYADSNGYFNADTDRPLAYRYRDWVVRALNDDKPFDRFVVEQLAGDELSGFVAGEPATPEMIALLEATHFLRNGQDGTGESDGNPDEVRTDRYCALESASQIVASCLLGLTMQCAKCHDHKFEPISQRDYYQLQAVFYPVFNINDWVKPNERHVYANLSGEREQWEVVARETDEKIHALRTGFAAWARENAPPSVVLFRDDFDDSAEPLAARWSNTAPGDDAPSGETPVALDSRQTPGAQRQAGVLEIRESGAAGDRWLSTRESFDWTPDKSGDWIQVTFELVDDKLEREGTSAARIAYLIALHDFNDNSPVERGNVLIDGNPAGGAAVHVDYPGADSTSAGELGNAKYQPGHRYGVRVTNSGKGKFLLEHLVDGLPDEKKLQLAEADLPNGGFGFEYCCGRSFKVDHLVIERAAESSTDDAAVKLAEATKAKQAELNEAIKALERQRGERPGKISCALDRSATPPEVFLLERGNYASPKDRVEPAVLSPLADGSTRLDVAPVSGVPSTGRRLAWARWLTQPGSRQVALAARVQANRVWRRHFSSGIVSTTENLGTSGAAPSHPELLEYLADEFVRSGWSLKALHRLILTSAAYRQSSAPRTEGLRVDPDNQLLWRWPLTRLDAESLRDAMLAVGGSLDEQFAGPYVPTQRVESGEVVVAAETAGAARRSIYLQQRRTQMLSLLNVFDAPSIVFNCVERVASTMPLQSLSQLNSEFTVRQADRFAERLEREATDEAGRARRAYQLAVARDPTPEELRAAAEFLARQATHYGEREDAARRARADFCQMLLVCNEFLYVE